MIKNKYKIPKNLKFNSKPKTVKEIEEKIVTMSEEFVNEFDKFDTNYKNKVIMKNIRNLKIAKNALEWCIGKKRDIFI